VVRREETERASAQADVRSASCCASPAGENPVSVAAGAPGSRPRAQGKTLEAQAGRQEPLRREQERGPQHQVKPAASTDSRAAVLAVVAIKVKDQEMGYCPFAHQVRPTAVAGDRGGQKRGDKVTQKAQRWVGASQGCETSERAVGNEPKSSVEIRGLPVIAGRGRGFRWRHPVNWWKPGTVAVTIMGKEATDRRRIRDGTFTRRDGESREGLRGEHVQGITELGNHWMLPRLADRAVLAMTQGTA
jgi:hypothetical protein